MKTREIHPRNLRRGDRIVVSFGIVRVASISLTLTHYTISTYEGTVIVTPIGQWPEIPQVEQAEPIHYTNQDIDREQGRILEETRTTKGW
jgi:hypothetical protein